MMLGGISIADNLSYTTIKAKVWFYKRQTRGKKALLVTYNDGTRRSERIFTAIRITFFV